MRYKILSAAVCLAAVLTGCAPSQAQNNAPNAPDDLTGTSDTEHIESSSAERTETEQATMQDVQPTEESTFEEVDLYYYYEPTIPPEFREYDYLGLRGSTGIYSCQITDDIPDEEKIEMAADILAEEYVKNYFDDHYDYITKIIDYRDVYVTFIAHTIDRNDIEYDYDHISIWNGIGDMEVSENAWVIDIDAEVRYDGLSMLGSGPEDWVPFNLHYMSSHYLLYREGDTFYLWSRNVYRYERVLPNREDTE